MVIFMEDVGFCGIPHWIELDYLLTEICLKRRKTKQRNRNMEITAIKRAVKIMTNKELFKARCCSHLKAFIEDYSGDVSLTPYKDISEQIELEDSSIEKRVEER